MSEKKESTNTDDSVTEVEVTPEIEKLIHDATEKVRTGLMKELDTAREDLKAEKEGRAAEKKAAEDAKKTDLEKANDQILDLQAQLAAKDSDLTVLKDARTNDQKINAITNAAAVSDFNDPADVHRFIDLSTVDVENLEGSVGEALEKLSAAKPYLVRSDEDKRQVRRVGTDSLKNGQDPLETETDTQDVAPVVPSWMTPSE